MRKPRALLTQQGNLYYISQQLDLVSGVWGKGSWEGSNARRDLIRTQGWRKGQITYEEGRSPTCVIRKHTNTPHPAAGFRVLLPLLFQAVGEQEGLPAGALWHHCPALAVPGEGSRQVSVRLDLGRSRYFTLNTTGCPEHFHFPTILAWKD